MSEELETFEVHLSAPQLRKFKAGKPFQLNSSQLSTGTTGHKVKLTVHRKHYRRMLSNIKGKKGFRFTDDVVKGGSFWNHARKAWDVVKHHATKAVDFVKEHAPKVLNFVKENIPRETITDAVNIGINEFAPKKVKGLAKRAVKKGVDYAYDTTTKSGLDHIKDLGHSLEPEIRQGIRMATPKEHKKRVNKILNIGNKKKLICNQTLSKF